MDWSAVAAGLMAMWLACGYIAMGIVKSGQFEGWKKANFRSVEGGRPATGQSNAYDREHFWLHWIWMMLGLFGLCVVAMDFRLMNREIGFRWWNPVPWITRHS